MGGRLSRGEILALLRSDEVALDQQLLESIREHVVRTPDMEVIREVERVFSMPIGALFHVYETGGHADFTEQYRGQCMWLKSYLALTGTNESPGIYHALSALTVASAAMGRRVWIPMGLYNIYPPMASILVGPSGLRKTTAIKTAARMLKFADFQIGEVHERFTPEALLAAMGREERPVIVVSPEMSVTMGRARYLEGLVPLMTRLLDHDNIEVRTMARGVARIEEVAFAFLGGTTVDWMLSEMDPNVVHGGFTGRFLMAYEKSTSRLVYRSSEVPDAKLAVLAGDLLRLVRGPSGPMPVTPAVDEYLEAWYVGHKLRRDVHPLSVSYLNRKLTHLLRLVMVLAVLSGSDGITIDHVQEGMHLLGYLEPGMFELFDALSQSPTAKDAEVIREQLEAAGKRGMTRAALMEVCVLRMSYQRYNEALSYMVMAGIARVDGDRVVVR